MFKYQVNYLTGTGWKQALPAAVAGSPSPEVVAEWLRSHADVQTALISQIWIPRTER